MSTESYRKWWILTKAQLENLEEYDNFIKQNTKPEKSRVVANHLISGLYTRYCMIVKDIDVCLDQICQPQKIITIRKLMDAATTRLNELKEYLREIDLSEIHYVDGTLIELKLVPQSIEILNPTLIFPRPDEIEEMWERIQKGERIYTRSPTLSPSASNMDTSKSIQKQVSLKTEEVETNDPAKEGEARKGGEEGKGDEKGKEGEGQGKEVKGEGKEGKEDGKEENDAGKTESKEMTPQEAAKAEKEEKKKKKASIKKLMFDKKELTPEEIEAEKKKEILTNAVKLIQCMERGRQARLYCLDVSRVKRDAPDPEKSPSRLKREARVVDPELESKAATGFQKLFRGHLVREGEKRREVKRRFLIGMYEPSWKSYEEFEKLKKNAEIRRQIAKKKIKEYADAIVNEKARVMRVIAPGLMEDIGDEIREWFYQWYIRARCFDKIPPATKGGTVLVVRCETFTPEEYLDEVERKRREKEKAEAGGKDAAKEKAEKEKKKKEAEKKKQEELKKKKEAEKKAKAKKKEFEFAFPPDEDAPPAMKQMAAGFDEYKNLWVERKLIDNPTDQIYMDMITDQKCYEMQLEVRKQVDELMRIELHMLNEALLADKAKAGKKWKIPKEKKEKVKKPKVDKKDLTRNRRTDDIFQELVDNGIIRTYPKVHLEDFKGDYSYVNWDKREEECDTLPCLGDIRQTVALNCILPLGVESMKKPKSVLIAGPKKCGKHLLANAIFTEAKAVLFDLSAPVLAGKYPGKDGMKMLVHLINKMSRLLQPSIIFFDGAEKTFYKKVPKDEKELEPKKMSGQLLKGIVKPLQPRDRVLVLGITNQPWAATAAGLKKAYERAILIPRTDYGSAYMFWRQYLMPYHGVDRNIDLSSLAKLSVNYPSCVIKEVVEEVMNPRRIIQLSYRPLEQLELYEVLIKSKLGPIPDKDWTKFLKWYKKTPLGQARAKYQIVIDKVKEAEAKQAEKAAAKKKK